MDLSVIENFANFHIYLYSTSCQRSLWAKLWYCDQCRMFFYQVTIDISLLAAWGPIIYLPAAVVSSWLMDRTGLKLSMQVNACLVAGLFLVFYVVPIANKAALF